MTILLKLLHRWSKGGRLAALEWRVVSTSTGLVVGLLVRRVINAAWARMSPSGRTPPLNAADRHTGWGEAMAWAASAGAGVGVARVVSDRIAAAGWEHATGGPPPGVTSD